MATTTRTSPVQLSGETPELTLRVEIEFAIATLPDDVKDPEPEDSRQVYGITELDHKLMLGNQDPHVHEKDFLKHVENTLISAGFPKTVAHWERHALGYDHLIYDQLNWSVQGSGNFLPSRRDPRAYNYNYHSCEIKSPILHGGNGLKTLNEALGTLKNRYRIMDSELAYHDIVGHQCGGPIVPGLKVEVRYQNKAFPDQTLKNLFGILWTFEKLLDSIHPSYMVSTDETMPLRDNCDLYWESLTATEALDRIFACSTADEVIALVLHEDPWGMQVYGAGGFPDEDSEAGDSVDEVLDYPYVTFNGHESTFDSARYQNWIKICTGLVDFAHRADPESLKKWLRFHTKDEKADDTLGGLAKGGLAKDLEKKLANAGEAKHELLKNWLDGYTKDLKKEKNDDVRDLATDLEKLSHSEQKEYTVIELLKDIGLPEQAEYYEGKTFVHDYDLMDNWKD